MWSNNHPSLVIVGAVNLAHWVRLAISFVVLFQRPQFLVPEPPSRGGGASQKIDHEKAANAQQFRLWELLGVDIWNLFWLKANTC